MFGSLLTSAITGAVARLDGLPHVLYVPTIVAATAASMAGAAAVLEPDGEPLLVQSALSGVEATLDALDAGGLFGEVLATAEIPFGPVLRGRATVPEA